MSKKIIYYLPLFGQLGNQLSIMAHLIAFAKVHGYVVIYPHSSNIKEALNNSNILSGRFHFSKILSNKLLSFVVNKLIKYLSFGQNHHFKNLLIINKEFSVDDYISASMLPNKIIITDWLFRYYSGVKNNEEYVRSHLSFKNSFYKNPDKIVRFLKSKYPFFTLVGIHIRRGDYIKWLNGKYHFDLNIYYANMKSLSLQIGNCVFVICSNEDIRLENNDNLTIEYISGSAIEDICVLSKCDYILGPPSTFSGWASFIGKTPIYFLQNKKIEISIEKFSNSFI